MRPRRKMFPTCSSSMPERLVPRAPESPCGIPCAGCKLPHVSVCGELEWCAGASAECAGGPGRNAQCARAFDGPSLVRQGLRPGSGSVPGPLQRIPPVVGLICATEINGHGSRSKNRTPRQRLKRLSNISEAQVPTPNSNGTQAVRVSPVSQGGRGGTERIRNSCVQAVRFAATARMP